MTEKHIFITGDIANDHFIIRGERQYFDSTKNEEKGTFYKKYKGGAFLIFDFLKTLVNSKQKDCDISRVEFGFTPQIFRELQEKNNSYASVSLFETKKESVWRINEFLGFGNYGDSFKFSNKRIKNPDINFNLFLLDDAGMDFGTHTNNHLWQGIIDVCSKSKKNDNTKFIICKKSGNIAKGNLLNKLLQLSNEGKINLITIISVTDIRKEEVRVSTGISWEQTALDLVYEIKNNSNLCSLLQSKYLIVTIGASGALFITKQGKGHYEYKLIFDPDQLEMEEEDKINGKIIGRMSCFTAAIAAKLNINKPNKNYEIDVAIKAGLTAIRNFHTKGYIIVKNHFVYPWKEILSGFYKTEYKFSSAYIPTPTEDKEFINNKWSILLDNYVPAKSLEIPDSVTHLARNIVIKGRSVLKNIPTATFYDPFTIDRKEIESLRNLKRLMQQYIEHGDGKKPLNIGVFGPPGSGKSFAVKEIAKGVMGKDVTVLEFNLSQFSSPADLIGALHQVRDKVLLGKIPLVFFDEFDSRKFEWLQYLLAPMQDGAFQEGQITHPVGKCIIAFAGGTSPTMEEFGPDKSDKVKFEDFVLKKGPDFISRLNGFINILGPNQKQIFNKKSESWENDKTDFCFRLRRACFIRKILEVKEDDFLDIDWGLMNALLTVEEYKHGSRSLIQILNELKHNSGGRKIVRSHLPSLSVLELCFSDIKNFLDCLKNETENLVEVYKMAIGVHQAYLENAKTKKADYDVSYEYLPGFAKLSNIAAATRISSVLELAHLKIVPDDYPEKMSQQDYSDYIKNPVNNYIEQMAAEEHKGWMSFHKSYDWVHDETRNDYEKKHDCLVDYPSLSEENKDKDRYQVLKYWEMLELVKSGIARDI